MQDNPSLTPAAKQRLEVALVVPIGTTPSGEIGIKTMEGGLYATARVYVPLEGYAAQWMRWSLTGCREAVTSPIIALRSSST